jgi:hypothetical protein
MLIFKIIIILKVDVVHVVDVVAVTSVLPFAGKMKIPFDLRLTDFLYW